MYALVDCNNFYASCEKLFRPDLRKVPVVVLSNNDGCIIARCGLAKPLVKMGEPYFKCKDLLAKHGCVVFSSNYTLYQDISNRVMMTLEMLAPKCEIYSIDEAWLDISNYPPALVNLFNYAELLKSTVYQHIGIPVGVGIAPTKTLAKLANHHAKSLNGICIIDNEADLDSLLKNTLVKDIWGVGRQLDKRLADMKILTAYDLAHTPLKQLKKQFSVMLERTALELQGIPCYGLEINEPKQQIVCSRSFGERITNKQQISQAIALYTTRACEKMRSQNSLAKRITLFIRTGLFNPNEPHRSVSAETILIHPSDDTRDFIQLANFLLDQLWQDGYRYAKAGITLSDFYSHNPYQDDLFDERDTDKLVKSQQLMQTLDKINQRFGSHTLTFASEGTTKAWQMSRNMLSPCYTTNIRDIPKVHLFHHNREADECKNFRSTSD